MASNKDLLSAQRYQRRRLTTAFSMGLPGGREAEKATTLAPLITGGVIAVIMIAIAAIMGKFAPALPDN